MSEKEKPSPDPRRTLQRVRVHRNNVDPENKDLAITVNDLGSATGRRVFAPGQIVELSAVQIGILRDSVETIDIPIPHGSGIYDNADPRKSAESHFPGFQARINRDTGVVTVSKRTPNYVIEPVI